MWYSAEQDLVLVIKTRILDFENYSLNIKTGFETFRMQSWIKTGFKTLKILISLSRVESKISLDSNPAFKIYLQLFFLVCNFHWIICVCVSVCAIRSVFLRFCSAGKGVAALVPFPLPRGIARPMQDLRLFQYPVTSHAWAHVAVGPMLGHACRAVYWQTWSI